MRFIDVYTVNGIQSETVYTIDDYPYSKVMTCPTVRDRHNCNYYNVPAAFDIETTNVACMYRDKCDEKYNSPECKACKNYVEPYAFMYHWQFCLDRYVIFGRTFEDFCRFFDRLRKALRLTRKKRLVIYVHNLAFEMQFIAQFINIKRVFARKTRQPLKIETVDGFEFRCSYILSNMTLDKFCANCENVIHTKNVGVYDYHEFRTPTTHLSQIEESYCYNDVRGLCECIADRLREDNIATIPLTSTGYVRRDCRHALQSNYANKILQRKCQLTPEQYILLKEAFRGGNTHANLLYVNEIIYDVISYDRASSYPHVMMVEKYPMKFISAPPSEIGIIIKEGRYAALFRARFTNIRQKRSYGIPYIDYAHCRNIQNYVNDNGRIIRADILEITITDVDMRIIKSQYTYDKIEISDSYIAKYDYLPHGLRKVIIDYYETKTRLKGDKDHAYEYAKSKNRINSIYGMCVTDITHNNNMFSIVDGIGEWDSETLDIKSELDKYYKNKNTFLTYQWGVWVTAHARYALQQAIDLVGDDIVYVDTDSVKCIGSDKARLFSELNRAIIAKNQESEINPIAWKDGKEYPMGIWDYEGRYDEFKTLGAKKYAVRKGNHYETTVAGLSKKCGSADLARNGMESFAIGKVYNPSGRTTAFYNDVPRHTITVNVPDGKGGTEEIVTGSNVAIIETTYTLGVTDEYFSLIESAK